METQLIEQSPAPRKLEASFFFREQRVLSERYPNPKCKDCLGVGYMGIARDPKIPTMSVGRNATCPCGSGRKFKKCHLPFVERMRMSGGTISTCHCVGHTQFDSNPTLEKMRAEMKDLTSALDRSTYLVDHDPTKPTELETRSNKLLEDMQSPEAQAALDKAFHASPEEVSEAAKKGTVL